MICTPHKFPGHTIPIRPATGPGRRKKYARMTQKTKGLRATRFQMSSRSRGRTRSLPCGPHVDPACNACVSICVFRGQPCFPWIIRSPARYIHHRLIRIRMREAPPTVPAVVVRRTAGMSGRVVVASSAGQWRPGRRPFCPPIHAPVRGAPGSRPNRRPRRFGALPARGRESSRARCSTRERPGISVSSTTPGRRSRCSSRTIAGGTDLPPFRPGYTGC